VEVYSLVHGDDSELLHLLQEEVDCGEGGVHAGVEHALQEGLALLQNHSQIS
jgi:hypothetical protein